MENFEKNIEQPPKWRYNNPENERRYRENNLEWLFTQTYLPPEKRDSSYESKLFLYLEKIAERKRQMYDDLDTTDAELIIQKYYTQGDLNKEEVKIKKILDLGCGPGFFIDDILSCNNEVYGLDDQINIRDLSEKLHSHIKQGDFTKEIPFNESFDLILFSSSIEHTVLDGKKEEAKEAIRLALKKLSPNGEIKIFPIRNYADVFEPDNLKYENENRQEYTLTDIKNIKQARSLWDEILQELKEEGVIDYEIKPIDFDVHTISYEYYLVELLTIKHPPKQLNK